MSTRSPHRPARQHRPAARRPDPDLRRARGRDPAHDRRCGRARAASRDVGARRRPTPRSAPARRHSRSSLPDSARQRRRQGGQPQPRTPVDRRRPRGGAGRRPHRAARLPAQHHRLFRRSGARARPDAAGLLQPRLVRAPGTGREEALQRANDLLPRDRGGQTAGTPPSGAEPVPSSGPRRSARSAAWPPAPSPRTSTRPSASTASAGRPSTTTKSWLGASLPAPRRSICSSDGGGRPVRCSCCGSSGPSPAPG